MKAGLLRFRATLQRPLTQIENEIGEVVLSNDRWEDVQDAWISIRPLTSGEILRARSIGLDTTHAVGMRYVDELTNDWRIKYATTNGTVFFNIKGMKDPDMLRSEWQLECVVSSEQN
jgi:SPP1 family predicted phage head-tail adaptor